MPSTQTVEFFAAPGQTVTASLFSAGSDTVVASVTATEQTNRKGVYRAVYTDVAAGLYRLLALVSATPIATWWTDLTLTTATFQGYEVPTSVFASQPINVYPVSASTPERVSGTTLTFYLNESRNVSITTDFTLTSMTLQFVVEDSRGNDVYTVSDASITKSSQTATIPLTSTVTGSLGQYNWSLRDITSGNSVIARGVLSVQNAASIG
jgi:hypothetical protein